MHRIPFAVLTYSVGLATVLAGQPQTSNHDATAPSVTVSRPIPYPVTMSSGYRQALENGTRSITGAPGPNYWQQWTDYTIHARLDPETKRIDGTVHINYHNRSPRTLPIVALQLIQDVHREGTMRNRPMEVTGGVEIKSVKVGAKEINAFTGRSGSQAGYLRQLTSMIIRPPQPVEPGDSVQIEIEYGFTVPHGGGRMGWNGDNLFYIAYWYPQMAVFDDVVGWQTDPFLGMAEFYMGYGDYDVSIDVPNGWTVVGTGRLVNADEVMPETIVRRLRRAEQSDTVVHVLTPEDFGPGKATRRSDSGWLTWHLVADSVRDVAFSATRESHWDAARIPVGDRTGDGLTEYARADAIWRTSAPRWANAWRYVQHSIDHHSRWTGFSYPWPHMTSVEGEGIMGGGMEFPMMTLIGPYTQRSDTALYGVHAHELAHMWVPMIVGVDERRRGWMDEGTTSFNTSQAEMEFYPGRNWFQGNYDGYLAFARTGHESEMMRWSDLQGDGYGVASYAKPATLLATLRGLLGEETFVEAYHTYIRTWAFKHPKPWDFFNTFNHVSGQNLDWFWRTWYFETWTLDQAVESVTRDGRTTTITVDDRGWAPMPARLTITLENGQTLEREVPVDTWLAGATSAEVTVDSDSPVVKVEIDAAGVFPDIDRDNNVWQRN